MNKETRRIIGRGLTVAGLVVVPSLAEGCSCGAPEPTPTTNSNLITRPAETVVAPTIKTPEVKSDFTFKHLSKGDFWLAKPGDILIGDLEVDGNILYDQKRKTGVITILKIDGRVTATKNEGVIIRPNEDADTTRIIEEQRREMLEKNKQIKIVTIQDFPGFTQNRTEEQTSTQTRRQTETQIREDKGFDVNFVPGETKVVASAVLSGDFRLNGFNGIKMYDNRGDTASILMIEGQATIFSEFGGSGNADFRNQAGLERKTTEILRQKLTEFREVIVDEIDINGNFISSVTFTREGLMIDNLVYIGHDRLVLMDGRVIFQDNAGINFDNRREDRREGRRQDRRNP